MKIKEIEALMAMAGFVETPHDYEGGKAAVVKSWSYCGGRLWLVKRPHVEVGSSMVVKGCKSKILYTMVTDFSASRPKLSSIHDGVRWAGSLHTVYNDLLKVLLEDPS